MYNPPTLFGIRPRRFGLVSWSPHVAFGYDLVADLRPRVLVELGTHSGESYFAFCQSVEENSTGTTCYAVDTWKGDPQAGFYAEDVYQDVLRHNQEFYANFSYLVRASFDDALDRFTDGSLDLIHFDGLHTYDAVRHDFQTWRRKLSPRGIALFHDIAARHDDFGAWKFWEEIRQTGENFEFRHGWGLGVLKPAGGAPVRSPLLQSLFNANPAQAENIRRYYLMATDALHHRAKPPETAIVPSGNLPPDDVAETKTLEDHPPILTVAPEPPAPQVQVYFPSNGHGFAEDRSQCFPLASDRWQRLEISLPSDWCGQSIRLDPADGVGVVDIAGVRIVSETFAQVVWECLGADLAAAVRLGGGTQAVPHRRVLQLLCSGNDPQIFLPEINVAGIDEPLRMEVGIRVRTVTPSLARTLQDWVGTLSDLPTLRAEVRQLHDELGRERDAHGRTTQSVGEWQLNERATRSGLEKALGTLHATNEQVAALLGEVDRARAHGDERAAILLAEVEAARLHGDNRVAALEQQLIAARDDARQHAAALLAEADAARAQVQEKTAALEQTEHIRDELLGAEDEARELQAEKFQWQQNEDFLQQEVNGLHGELHALQERLATIHQSLVEAHAALDTARQGEAENRGRVRSMQDSVSWKLTLPLRVLGRAVTGKRPGGRPAVPPTTLPGSAEDVQPQSGYRFNLDAPTDWNLPSQRVRVRGWCIPPLGKQVPALRFRCGDHVTQVACNVPRPDVQASFNGGPEWSLCGYETEIELPGGPSQLLIEIVDEQGKMFPAARYDVRAPYAAIGRRIATLGDPSEDYAAWIARYDTLSAKDRRRLRAQARTLPQRLISVVMPVYNTPERWLVKAIESVRAQLYPYWELCIADDHSPKPHVREILARYEHLDPRIKVCYREQNGHISEASNSALALATGEFIALLDHDDELAAHALYTVALELQDHPKADLIYSDEDKIDENGQRFAPYFKSAWNPDLLRGQNFISHLGVYRRDRVTEVGGFRPGYEGCQDWDLALRITERVPTDHIRHLPRVLYHWRAIEGSTARAVKEKDYIVSASRRVLVDHCERTGQLVSVLPVVGGHFRVRYQLPTAAPLVSIIIPTHNQLALLRRGIDILRAKTTYPRYEILVVDNRSDDPDTLAYLADLQRRGEARVLPYPRPFNYSAINNFAVQQAAGELVCLMNNDVEVITPDWLEEMASHALRPEIGAVGAALYYPDDTIQHAGVILGLGGVAGHVFSRMPRGTDGYFNRARLVQNLSAVTAACLVVRRAVYGQVGGLNESLKVAFNDVDFCLKVQAAGHRNLWTPHAEFYHHESASRGAEDTIEKHQRFVSEVEYMQAHWHALIADDPAYNLNLTVTRGDCQMAAPPRVLPLNSSDAPREL